jgi:hypothetical protein
VRALADRVPLVSSADVVKAEAWFARHGAKAVFLGRMVPLVRSLISVPAGVERMPLPLFAALTAAGSLLWNTAFVLAGYWLGASWPVVEQYADVASKAVLAVLVVAVVVFAVRRIARRRRSRQAAPGADSEAPTMRLPAAGQTPRPPVDAHPRSHPRVPGGHRPVPGRQEGGLPDIVGGVGRAHGVTGRRPSGPPRTEKRGWR